MSNPKPLTTGQAARYCNVSQVTIINWIKQGKLNAYATPGGHHRIPLPDFLAFLENYHMPVDSTLQLPSLPRVLIVSDSAHGVIFAQALRDRGRFTAAVTCNGYDASAKMVSLEPSAVILDTTIEAQDSLSLCRWMRAAGVERAIPVLAVGTRENEKAARDAGVDAYLLAPADTDRLTAAIESLLRLPEDAKVSK